MDKRIGYFIPEFPGQTHIFFWRERQVLSELGVDTCLISTKLPPKGIVSHTWADDAQRETNYLLPFSFKDFGQAVVTLARAGIGKWLSCFQMITQADDLSVLQKLELLKMLPAAGKLILLMKQLGLTHIHVHSCANTLNLTLIASLLSDITYSLTLHGPTLELYGANQKQKWKHALFALVVSQKLLDTTKKKLNGSFPAHGVFAPMGVNVDKIKRYHPYHPWEPDQPCQIFACGRLNPVKGHHHLIEAVGKMRSQGLDVRLKIAGEDEQGGSGYHQELEDLIREKSLSDAVHLLGAISEGEIRRGLEEAHIFCLASLNEGISVAVMEAMAMEIPVVVTDVGGMSELIDDGINGILIPPEQPDRIVAAVEKIMKNQEWAHSLSQKSREKIVDQFNHYRSAEELKRLLKG
jgi:colanic acid/amylovoran biosynthesis glycosyltransferase